MPYNTGDFTQQGVAGYVNGGLLLNNKRDVTTRISTDEESAGIDSVDIKIKDRLNDIEYHITGENLTEGENVIGGGGGVTYKAVFNPITEEIEPTEQGFYVIENYDANVLENNETFILEINMNLPIYLEKTVRQGGIMLHDAENKNGVIFTGNQAVINLDPTYGPYDYPSSYIFLYATYFQDSDEGGED